MSGSAAAGPDRFKKQVETKVSAMSDPTKPNNAKTGLILAGLAIFFFAMVFIKRVWL